MWRGTGSCQRVNIRATQAQTSADIPHIYLFDGERDGQCGRERDGARAYSLAVRPIGVRLQLIAGKEIVVAGFY